MATNKRGKSAVMNTTSVNATSRDRMLASLAGAKDRSSLREVASFKVLGPRR
jgi:hypothetical protein